MFSLSPTLLVSLPLTDLSHLVNYRLRAFLLVWLHFQGILQLTLRCFKLFIQRENNLWFLTPSCANGCHPCLTFRHTVSWEPGSVFIKPSSCHSILTSTIENKEQYSMVAKRNYHCMGDTALVCTWHSHPAAWPEPEGNAYSTFIRDLSIFRHHFFTTNSLLSPCPLFPKWLKYPQLMERCGYSNNRQKCQWKSRKPEITLPLQWLQCI